MHCSKCNGEIVEGQEVCLKCGHILGYESEISKPCIHCSREIPIAYKKCPYCKKTQKSHRLIKTIVIILLATTINYLCLSILYSPSVFVLADDYKKECEIIDYMTLVRKNTYYDEAYVKVKGEIKEVESISNITKKIKITLFVEDNPSSIIEVKFNNNKSIGYVSGDKVEIYGKYKEIKGNTPVIKARYIEFVKKIK